MDNERFDPVNDLSDTDVIEDNSLTDVINSNNNDTVLDNNFGDVINGGDSTLNVGNQSKPGENIDNKPDNMPDDAPGSNNENVVPSRNASGSSDGINVSNADDGKAVSTDHTVKGTVSADGTTEGVAEGTAEGMAEGTASAGGLKGAMKGASQITHKMINKMATKMGIPSKAVSLILAASVGLSSMVAINSTDSDQMENTFSEVVTEDKVVTHANEQMQYFGALNGKQKIEAAHKIYNYFKAIGYTDEAIAGILSNIEAESSLRGDYYTGKEISMYDSFGEMKKFGPSNISGRNIMFEYYDKDWYKYMAGLYMQYNTGDTAYNGAFTESPSDLMDYALGGSNVPDGDGVVDETNYASLGLKSYNRALYDAKNGDDLTDSVFAVKNGSQTVNALPGFGLFQFAGDRANDFLYFANCQDICSDYNFDQINDEWVSIPMQIAFLYFENKECEPGMTINEWGTRDWYQGVLGSDNSFYHGEDDGTNLDQFGKFCLVDRFDTFMEHYNDADDPATPDKNEAEWYWDPENWAICHVVISRTSMNDVVVEYLTIKIDEEEEERWLDALDKCKTAGFDKIKNHKILETLYTMNYSVMVYTISIPASELTEESKNLDPAADVMIAYQKDPRIRVANDADVELDAEGNPKDLYHLFKKLSTNEAIQWMKDHYPNSYKEYDDFNKKDPNVEDPSSSGGSGGAGGVVETITSLLGGGEEATPTEDSPSHGAFRTVSRWEWDCTNTSIGAGDDTKTVELPKDSSGSYYDDKLNDLYEDWKQKVDKFNETAQKNKEYRSKLAEYKYRSNIYNSAKACHDTVIQWQGEDDTWSGIYNANNEQIATQAWCRGRIWGMLDCVNGLSDVANSSINETILGFDNCQFSADKTVSFSGTTVHLGDARRIFNTSTHKFDNAPTTAWNIPSNTYSTSDPMGALLDFAAVCGHCKQLDSTPGKVSGDQAGATDLYGYYTYVADMYYKLVDIYSAPNINDYAPNYTLYTDAKVEEAYNAAIAARQALATYYAMYSAAGGPKDQLLDARKPYQADKRDIDYKASFVDSGVDGETEYITPTDRLYDRLHTYKDYTGIDTATLATLLSSQKKHLLGTDTADQGSWPDPNVGDSGKGFYENHPIEDRDDYRGITGSRITDYTMAGGAALQRGFDDYHYIDQYDADGDGEPETDDAFKLETITPTTSALNGEASSWMSAHGKTDNPTSGLSGLSYYTNTAGSNKKEETYNKYKHRYKILWNKYDNDSDIAGTPTNSFWDDAALADKIASEPNSDLSKIIDYSYSNSLLSNVSDEVDAMDPADPTDDFNYKQFNPTGGEQNGYAGYLANASYTFRHLLEKAFRTGNIYQDGEDIAFENAIYFYNKYLGYPINSSDPYAYLAASTSQPDYAWFRQHVLKSRYWYNIITTQKWAEAYKDEINAETLVVDDHAGDDGLGVTKEGKYWMEIKSYLPSESKDFGNFDLSGTDLASKMSAAGLTSTLKDYEEESVIPRGAKPGTADDGDKVRDIMRSTDVSKYFNLDGYNNWTGEDSRIAYNLKGNKFDNSTISSTAISMSYPYSYQNYACDDPTTVGKGFVYDNTTKYIHSIGIATGISPYSDKTFIGRKSTRQYVAVKTIIDFYEKQMRFDEKLKDLGLDYGYDVVEQLESISSVSEGTGVASEIYQNNNFNDMFGALSTIVRASGRDDAFPSNPYMLYWYLGIGEMGESVMNKPGLFAETDYDNIVKRMKRDEARDKSPKEVDNRTWSLWDVMHKKEEGVSTGTSKLKDLFDSIFGSGGSGGTPSGSTEPVVKQAPGSLRWHLVGKLDKTTNNVAEHRISYKRLKPGDICITDKFCFVYVGTDANAKFGEYQEFKNAKYAVCYASTDYSSIHEQLLDSNPGYAALIASGNTMGAQMMFDSLKDSMAADKGYYSTGLTCRSVADDGKTPYIEQLIDSCEPDKCILVYRSDNPDYEQSPYYKMLSSFDYRDYQDGGHDVSLEYAAGSTTSFFSEFPGMNEVKLAIVNAHAVDLEKRLGQKYAAIYRKWSYKQIYGPDAIPGSISGSSGP